MYKDHDKVFGDQDDCLIALSEGRLDEKKLRELPPWRAVLIARIAVGCRVMDEDTLQKLILEAKTVGGAGTLNNDSVPEKIIKEMFKKLKDAEQGFNEHGPYWNSEKLAAAVRWFYSQKERF